MENTEENCEMIWKIQKKGRFNCEMICIIWKKIKLNSEKIGKTIFFSIFHIFSLFSSVFSKSFHYLLPYFPYHFTIFFHIVHIFSLFNLPFFDIFHIISRFSSGRNPSWIVKRFGKYRRKLWKDMKNMEEK
jgi:hypothetical protein